MGLIERAEKLLIERLPPPVVQRLQALKAKLPTRLPQAHPIAVMYVADRETRSYVGMNNFYSFLLASELTSATAELRFYAPSGAKLFAHRLALAHFGAAAVDVKELFASKRVDSPYGIVAVQITPREPRRVAYRELGRVHSQFFVFYEGGGSVAQVHPLSQIGPQAAGEPFESSQVITTRGLAALEVLQYNPSTRAQPIEHRLVDASTNAIVARAATQIAAMGSCRARFSDVARLPERLVLTVDRLPSPNSKPMLRRVFASGVSTMSHA